MNTGETPSVQHRIYLGPPREGLAMDDIQRHWIENHSEIVKKMPLLGGYVQNRPVEATLRDSKFAVCVETWFASRADEQTSYSSEYYLNVISPDERDNIIEQASSWNSAVADTGMIADGDRSGFRLLVFGADTWPDATSPSAGRTEVLHLRGSAPFDAPPVIFSVWFEDEDEALKAGAGFTRFSMVTRPTAVVPPAHWS
ncbi:MAG: EthD domain-containing protein [Actinomycetota bacterium]|nr:EthD domain-containing protein [Actinomycetota bacterium]